ncbi:BSD domain-containing protein C22A12.14c [Golovinomyces cichoracearum]|uniref:BSD domain-containing protein C22A12.14c n=1 Tax=Golovinomyces cichoracearum TaxID=62708 RepID=A0A420IK95_9PEZI|nr:BSD domain-containing protein C22A12.14c [Golovinomyces cichoracearum]
MDLAYDHIQEKALTPEEQSKSEEKNKVNNLNSLNSDFQEACKAISSSSWGAKLGGFLGTVVKQSGEVYKEAQRELSEVGEEATKGLTDLRSTIVSRTGEFTFRNIPTEVQSRAKKEEKDSQGDDDTVESDGVLARLKSEATKRLKDIERAEDAADEALLKFGSNIRNFLREAVTISPGLSSLDRDDSPQAFESKDPTGKRVIHTTRFDVQLHAIHSSLDSFKKDPVSDEYESWKNNFNVEEKTEAISKYLETYSELRLTMEMLVPDVVSYTDFWTRYHFLRHCVEVAEAKRKDLLRGAVDPSTQEEFGWDEESDDESEVESKTITGPMSAESSITFHPKTQLKHERDLKPEESRKSQDNKSMADSDASYDVVGTASAIAPGSPQETRTIDESEEEDWE